MGRLNSAEFLSELNKLLSSNNGKSSIYLTQKRLAPALSLDSNESTINDLPSSVINNESFESNRATYPVLVRISMNGKDKKDKKKLSTVVETENLDQFWMEYVQVIKNGFVGLKKKDKKKSKKAGKISK